MTFFRVCTVPARLVRQISVGSTVMSNHGVEWLCTVIFVQIGKGGSEFCDVLQCFDDLKFSRSEH